MTTADRACDDSLAGGAVTVDVMTLILWPTCCPVSRGIRKPVSALHDLCRAGVASVIIRVFYLLYLCEIDKNFRKTLVSARHDAIQ